MQAVSALGKGLGMQKSYSTQSYYGDYYEGDFSVNGKILHLRISTHPANGTRIGNALADDKISLVVRKNGEHVSLGEHNGYTEYVYEPSEILPKDAANGIVRTVERLIRTGEFVDETGGKGEIRISNTAVSKFLSESAVEKSDNKDVHLSVLKSLPEVIRESVDAEQHPDYKKGTDGKRSEKNGVNENVTIHRLYSAVNIDGQLYRVKITLKADKTNKEAKKAYSYEATKIELLAGQHEEAVTSSRNANNSITSAKLLNGVEKSYWNGEKIINSSKVLDENGEPLVVSHATDSDFTVFDKSKAGENTDSNATDENLAKVGASLLIV